jgi:cytochrome c
MTRQLALFTAIMLLSAAPAMAADPDEAAAELQKCKICHTLDTGGANRVGPNLHGVFGRKAGTVAGFNYSDVMRNSGIVWDDDSLAKFLRGPQESMPGNRMSFPGVKDEATLSDLLEQLKQTTQ